ncbi:MAG TPA: epimerase, partial [Verrucomicrobiae bacterium]|nr:epimerase [Verrucomicrobiae bacterium]
MERFSEIDAIRTEEQLTEVLTSPSAVLVDFIRSVESPLVVLGAGGKMGPTLAVLAKRAAVQAGHALEVVAASRF